MSRLHVQVFFQGSPYDLGIAENLSHVLGRHWWQWLFFWARPERVRRYGHYADRDLPYADWIVRYRSDLLMGALADAAHDAATMPPPIHGRMHHGTNRRQQQHSSALSDDGIPLQRVTRRT